MRVIVLGGGVSGLSCGVRLLEAGYLEEGVSLLERARQEAAHVGPIANPSITGSSDGT
jgi:glycine/D-amino acid oxidase-like deaminating enzyme